MIAAFPDVCLSPPSPPAGPVPVPYPNTSFSKDMQNGSKTVMIKGKEVMLKDQSFYKTSPLGDEAATNEPRRGRGHACHHGEDVLRGLVDGRAVRGPERRPPHRPDGLQRRERPHVDPARHAEGLRAGAAAVLRLRKSRNARAARAMLTPTRSRRTRWRCGTGQKSSEADWHGPDGHAKVQEARAKGCPCVPETPRGRVRDDTSSRRTRKQRQTARHRWTNKYKPMYAADYNAKNAEAIANGSKTPIVIEHDKDKQGEADRPQDANRRGRLHRRLPLSRTCNATAT